MRHQKSSLLWGPALLCLLLGCSTVSDDGRAWGTPERLDEEVNPAPSCAVALDGAGTATVIWAESDYTPGAIFARHQEPSSTWDPIEQIDNNIVDSVDYTLAGNRNGDLLALWREGFGKARATIWSNRFTPANGWEAPIRLDPADQDDATDAHAAIDPAGNAVAVWHQSDGTRERVWTRRSTPEDGWSRAELIDAEPRGHAGDPRVAMDGKGNAIAVWHHYDAVRPNIWANRYSPDDGWDQAQQIESNEREDALLPQVAMDPEGNAIVVWQQTHGSRFDVWATRFTPANRWEAPEKIDSEHTGDAANATVGMDADGNAIAVWTQFDGNTVEIWSNRFTPEEGWGAPERLDVHNDGDAFDPRVAVSGNGEAVAAWLQSDGVRYELWSNAYTPGDRWGIAERIDPNDQGIGQPVIVEVAIDPEGNAMAVWARRDRLVFATNQIWAARYE